MNDLNSIETVGQVIRELPITLALCGFVVFLGVVFYAGARKEAAQKVAAEAAKKIAAEAIASELIVLRGEVHGLIDDERIGLSLFLDEAKRQGIDPSISHADTAAAMLAVLREAQAANLSRIAAIDDDNESASAEECEQFNQAWLALRAGCDALNERVSLSPITITGYRPAIARDPLPAHPTPALLTDNELVALRRVFSQ